MTLKPALLVFSLEDVSCLFDSTSSTATWRRPICRSMWCGLHTACWFDLLWPFWVCSSLLSMSPLFSSLSLTTSVFPRAAHTQHLTIKPYQQLANPWPLCLYWSSAEGDKLHLFIQCTPGTASKASTRSTVIDQNGVNVINRQKHYCAC